MVTRIEHQPAGEQPAPVPDLSAVEALAGTLEGAADEQAQAQAQADEQATAQSEAAALLGALKLARVMVGPMFRWWPDFESVWSDQTLDGISEGAAAVMARHGWTVAGAMGELGPYIALIGATAPPAFVTYQAIQHRKAQLRHMQQRPMQPPPAATEGGAHVGTQQATN